MKPVYILGTNGRVENPEKYSIEELLKIVVGRRAAAGLDLVFAFKAGDAAFSARHDRGKDF